MAKTLKPQRKTRVPAVIPNTEIEPVINLLKQGKDFQVIQRRRERPYRYIGQCIVHKIDNLEAENRKLRELLIYSERERRGILGLAA